MVGRSGLLNWTSPKMMEGEMRFCRLVKSAGVGRRPSLGLGSKDGSVSRDALMGSLCTAAG